MSSDDVVRATSHELTNVAEICDGDLVSQRARRAIIMEMHQIRYFLAAARTLNFTRAAEECNVAQPSLTRAIQQLEQELGSKASACCR